MAGGSGGKCRRRPAPDRTNFAKDEQVSRCQTENSGQPGQASRHNHGRLTIRVEGLLNGGRLTKGQNNGDRTWSLTPDELNGLKYVPPHGGFTSHTLWIRVLAMDEGFANTVGVFALEVDPDSLPPRLPLRTPGREAPADAAATPRPARKARPEAPAPDLAAVKADLESQMTARIETMRAELEAETRRHASDAQNKHVAETSKQLKDAKAAWQKEADQKFAEAKAAWRKESEQELAEAKTDVEAQMPRRIKAESGGKAEDQAAKAQAVSELETRLQAAEKRAGEAEKAGRTIAGELAELKTQKLQLDKALEKAEARAVASEKATLASDAKLVDAMAKLARADEAVKKTEKKAAAAADDQIKALRAEMSASEKAHKTALKAAQDEARKSVDAEYVQALEALRQQHAAELKQKLARERESLTAEFESRMADVQSELEKAASQRVGAVESGIENAIADACATAVAEARADWERENERNLAQASEAWKRDQDQRLAAGRVEWEAEQQEALEAAKAAWQQELETSLAAAAGEARRAQEAAVAARDGHWQGELERRLGELHARGAGDLDQRLETARAEWERSHEAALIERDDAWRDHIEKKLKEARAQWQAEEERRLAAARADWERAAFAPQTPAGGRGHEPARPGGAEPGVSLLNLQDKLPDPEYIPAPSRRGGGKGRNILRKLYRSTIGKLPMRGMARLAVLALVVVAGYYAYPHLRPLVVDNIGSIAGNVAAKIQGIGARMWAPSKPSEERISPLVGTRMFIRPSSANLRSSPATNADAVGVVERATVVEIITDKGSWLEVRTIGRSIKQGWIHRSLLADKPFS
jgi:hypothetical protein